MPAPTAVPVLPLAEGPGASLPLSLGLALNADGHLTGAVATGWSSGPAWVLTSLGRSAYALAGDGRLLWQARTAGPAYSLAILGPDRVAAGDDAGAVTALDPAGRRAWRLLLGSRVTALAAWQGGLLAAGWDERLTFVEVEAESGRVRWQAALESPATAIAGLPGLALVATAAGQVHAFDITGAEVWRYEAGSPAVRLRAAAAPIPWAALVGLQDGRLVALDGRGESLWEADLGDGAPAWSMGVAAGETEQKILAGTGGAAPELAALSAGGAVLWRRAMPAPVNAVILAELDGGGGAEILAGLDGGQVLVLDGDGQRLGGAQAGLPVWHLVEAGPPGATGVLALADVAAWRAAGREGEAAAAWLAPPATLPAGRDALETAGGATPAAGEAELLFLGDVSPGRSMEAQLLRYGPGHPWRGLEPLLSQADLVAVNLECALTTRGRPMDKPYVIRAHPAWDRMLAAGSVDLAALANNHVLDYGPEGLEDTLQSLEALGVQAAGAGRTAAEAGRPALFALEGVRVAVLAYAGAYWNGSADIPATDQIAWAEPAAVQAGVREALGRADIVVVILHAGQEYARQPSASQVAAAHAAVEAGAHLVIGHHPHVTQTVERYRDGLIVYSLGDAVFDIPRQAAMQGDLLRVRVNRDGLVAAEIWPFWIDGAIQPRLLDDGQGGPVVRRIYP